MAKKERKSFIFEQLEAPISKPTSEIVGVQQANSQTAISGSSTKITFDCPNELVEMMKDYGYWEGLSQKEIIIESLQDFFEDKTIKTRPEKVKNRKKVGRKPKTVVTNPYFS